MAWTDRREDIDCCPGGLGPVRNTENLARLTIRRTKEPLNYTPFNQSDLYPPTKEACVNECGTLHGQHGFSVDRVDGLSDARLQEMSEAFAAIAKNRAGNGAYVASAASVRSITSHDSSAPAFKIYDDALDADKLHAVIRGCEHVPREERPTVFGELQDLFEEDHRRV